jgi:hypothetical protein
VSHICEDEKTVNLYFNTTYLTIRQYVVKTKTQISSWDGKHQQSYVIVLSRTVYVNIFTDRNDEFSLLDTDVVCVITKVIFSQQRIVQLYAPTNKKVNQTV